MTTANNLENVKAAFSGMPPDGFADLLTWALRRARSPIGFISMQGDAGDGPTVRR